MKQITLSSFIEEVKQSTIPVLVDFWAEWCAPCKMLSPVLEETSEQFLGMIKVVGVDADTEEALTQQFEIKALPTVLIFNEGEIVSSVSGFRPKQHWVDEIYTILESIDEAHALE